MSHPQDLGLREQAALVASGELDPAELLADTLARIEERDGDLNSVVARFPEESERMLAEAPRGPLYGVPVAVKDMYQLPWRGPRDGTDRESLPPGESALFRLLRDAGAVIVGVTNMHWWGGGSTGIQSAYGPVGNPWDVKACGGGSSGGSAAAVGARLVAGAVGTDGGGSVRLPAAYCGVTGLKLTFGSVSREGYTHAYASMGAAGPLCRDAADARLLGGVMAQRDLGAGDARGSRIRAGLVQSPFWENVDPEVECACRELVAETGWEVEEIALEGVEHSVAATIMRLTLEGLPDHTPEELAAAPPLARAVVKYQMLLPARHLVQADRVRALLRGELARAFERCDVVVWPTVPAPAPPIENPVYHLPEGEVRADAGNVRQTGIGNLAGIPGISVPAGTHSCGMPMALQLQAAWGEEATLCDAAEHIERVTGREFVDAVPPIAAGAPA
ncbi:MAG: amidase [Gaiellaceae bacterium]